MTNVATREKEYSVFSTVSWENTDNRVFEKQILKYGVVYDPNRQNEFVIDEGIIDEILTSYNKNAVETIPLLLGTHDDMMMERTVGVVNNLYKKANGLYARVEVTDDDTLQKINTKTEGGTSLYSGVSVKLALYPHEDGEDRITLFHVAITHKPVVKGMEDFRSLFYRFDVDSSVLLDSSNEQIDEKVEEVKMAITQEELINELRELGIEVDSIDDLKEKQEKLAKLANEQEANESKVSTLSVEVSEKDKVIREFQANEQNMSKRIQALELENKRNVATREVEKYITEGKIVPAQKDTYITLYISDADLFTSLMSEQPVVVDTRELGYSTGDADIDGSGILTNEQVKEQVSHYKTMLLGSASN